MISVSTLAAFPEVEDQFWSFCILDNMVRIYQANYATNRSPWVSCNDGSANKVENAPGYILDSFRHPRSFRNCSLRPLNDAHNRRSVFNERLHDVFIAPERAVTLRTITD